MLFLPQKPYIPIGTLRDAVTYPAAARRLLRRGDLRGAHGVKLDRSPRGWTSSRTGACSSAAASSSGSPRPGAAPPAGLALPGRGDLGPGPRHRGTRLRAAPRASARRHHHQHRAPAARRGLPRRHHRADPGRGRRNAPDHPPQRGHARPCGHLTDRRAPSPNPSPVRGRGENWSDSLPRPPGPLTDRRASRLSGAGATAGTLP